MFGVAKRCSVVSLSFLEVIFCKSDVCFSRVVVLARDDSLIDD